MSAAGDAPGHATPLRAAAVVCAALGVPLLLFPAGPLVYVGIAAALISVGLAVAALRASKARLPALADAAILLLVLSALVGLWAAMDRSLALNRALSLLACVTTYSAILAQAYGRPAAARNVAMSLALLAPVVALFAVVSADWTQAAIVPATQPAYGLFPNLISRVPGSGVPRVSELVSPRHAAGVLAVLLPLCAAVWLNAETRAWRWLGGAATVVTALVMVVSQTVLAWVAAGVALVVMAGLIEPRGRVFRIGIGAGLAGVLISVAMLAVEPLRSAAGNALEAAIDFPARSLAHLDMLRLAGLIMADTPWTGGGLNNFPLLVMCFYPHPAERDIAFYPHAHNVLAQAAADFGVFGVLALAALFVSALAAAAIAARSARPHRERVIAAGLAAALTAYLAFGLFDAVTIAAKSAPAVWALLALARSMADGAPSAGRLTAARVDRWLIIGLVLLTAGLVVVSVLSGSLQQNMALIACRQNGSCAPLNDVGCPLLGVR